MLKLTKEECMACFSLIEQGQIRVSQAKFVLDLLAKLDKEIIRLDKLEKKENGGN